MKEILEKLLEDVDPDIREFLLKESHIEVREGRMYKNWELLPDATMTALHWQFLRDNKK